jgi:adenosylhomocysteine nucleosidase
MNLLVCFAVKEEAAPFLEGGKGDGARVLVTGMGCRNTTRAFAVALMQGIPDKVLTCGFAGGLKPGLKRGTVVCETGDAPLKSALCRAGAIPGRFLCVDRIATTSEEKRALRQSSGADAVEMESGAVQEECRKRGIPCATVRVILDEAGEDLPLDFNAFMTNEAGMSWVKLMMALVRAPGRIPALLRFHNQTRVAAGRLKEVLLRLSD